MWRQAFRAALNARNTRLAREIWESKALPAARPAANKVADKAGDLRKVLDKRAGKGRPVPSWYSPSNANPLTNYNIGRINSGLMPGQGRPFKFGDGSKGPMQFGDSRKKSKWPYVD